MRKLLLALPFLFLLAGCQCRQGSQAPMVDSLVGEVVEAAFEPVFEAAPIPPAVEARMRGVSYPENAEIICLYFLRIPRSNQISGRYIRNGR